MFAWHYLMFGAIVIQVLLACRVKASFSLIHASDRSCDS